MILARIAAVTLAYAALTFILAYPFSAQPGTTVVADAPDTHLYIWTLAWDTHAFTHQPLRIFDANIYHPYPYTLAYSENLIGSALFAAPIIWLTGNPVLAMNLVALLTCILCGLGAFVLARRLGLGVAASFLCGLVFAFAPPRFFRMGQLHMTAVQWIPFALAYLHAYFDQGRKRDLRIAIAFFSLQALTSGHGAVFLTLAAVLLSACRLAAGGSLSLKQRIRDVGITGTYLLAPAVLVLLPYRAAQIEAGLRRAAEEEAVPTLESFLASPSWFHQWVHDLIGRPDINYGAVAYLFPGIVVLALAAYAMLRARNRDTWFYAGLAVVCLMLFLPPPFGLWKYVYWLPGLNFIRVPSRFAILALLALSMLMGAGFERLTSTLTAPRRAIAAVLTAILLFVEYVSVPFAAVPFHIDTPAVHRWLAAVERPFVFASVPVASINDVGTLERQQTRAMLDSMAHWQKTVNGYSGIRRPLHDRLFRELSVFPDDASIEHLRELGVTYVVVRSNEYGAELWKDTERRLTERDDLRLVHAAGADRVYAIVY